jgi:subtilisin family serine protease
VRSLLPGAGNGAFAGPADTPGSSRSAPTAGSGPPASLGKILILLQQQADLSDASTLPTKEAKGRYIYETLWTVAQEAQQDLRSTLDAQGISYQAYYIVNAIKVRADSTLVRSLAARHDVAHILPNPQVRGVPPHLPESSPEAPLSTRAIDVVEANLVRVNADDVWALGYSGQGIIVAGQDTGYDWEHPALVNQYRGWNGTTADHDYNWHDAIHEDDPHTSEGNRCGFDSPVPCDDHPTSHGTHTMGIMVGDDGETHQIGMAPGARWIGCRNMEEGWGTPASYMECFEFFLAPYPVDGTPAAGDPSLAPHVVNNSWSCPPTEGCDSVAIALLEASVEALRQAGIMVVVSAGNYGPSCSSVQYLPAIYPQSTAVGNFDHRTDQIQWSSSRGPVTYDGNTYIKPEISAPGVSINSSIRGGIYDTMSGTSMAAPHVAGAAALLLSAAPGYSGHPDAIEYILINSAEPMTTTEGCGGDGPDDVPNNTWGWGILDAPQAVDSATAGSLEGTVSDADTGSPIAGAVITAQVAPGPAGPTSTTGASGQYSTTLALGTYDITARATGYFQQTVTNVTVTGEGATLQDFGLLPVQRFYLPLILRGW